MSESSGFDFTDSEDDEPREKRMRQQAYTAPSWLHTASAVLVGVFVAGVLLGLVARAYVHYSLRSWAEPPARSAPEKTVPTMRK